LLPLPANAPLPSITSLGLDTGDAEPLTTYWTFYWAVAAAQLARWLPSRPARLLDLSGPRARCSVQAAAAGHTVVELLSREEGGAVQCAAPRWTTHVDGATVDGATVDGATVDGATVDGATVDGTARGRSARGRSAKRRAARGKDPGGGAGRPGTAGRARRGRIHPVAVEPGTLGFLADGCMDAVIAEDRVLSRHLVTEAIMAEIARVLRPGGRALLCVDSLVLGMAILAEQKYWAHLSDVPRAEVVLVPWPNGIITRCFWIEELRELLLDAGLEAEWIRPRTVLSPSTVEHVLAVAPRELARLVRTELATPVGEESVGIHLVASAVKPG
jgi:hypothetical protein